MNRITSIALVRGTFAIALALSVAPSGADQRIADDLVVDGSACIGLDCVEGESFFFDTLRLKENNLRILFSDTSTSASFPSTDWQLTANESSNGGANAFFLENVSAGSQPWAVDAQADDNAFFLGGNGAGFGTAVPVLDLHAASPNTPALRLEQNGLGAFTPQTWDVGGNEIYFFVRDVTNGSRLPLKILPGASTNALVVDTAGNLILGNDSNASSFRLVVRNIANDTDLLTLDNSGNLTASGMVSGSSSKKLKSDIHAVDNDALLQKLSQLDILEWQYSHDQSGARHMGAMAEDFHALFGLGSSAEFLAPSDMAGVALAAIRAQQDRIEALEAALAERDARLHAVEQAMAQQQASIQTRLERLESRLPSLQLTRVER